MLSACVRASNGSVLDSLSLAYLLVKEDNSEKIAILRLFPALALVEWNFEPTQFIFKLQILMKIKNRIAYNYIICIYK